ncbi:Guanine Nucleotide Exchange Factor Dbs [Manis pentadactyla]|nr:Guanine Nucleotide Exchange Factor Dbs [Manis pentadactyla]KAI5212297.1 Guanine Nucleotide Exchange Factor Dbs [Manis pentadactyla]
MVDQGYGEAWVTSVVKVKCEILEPGLQLALVVSRHNSITERVRSGSDVTGAQDGGSGLWYGVDRDIFRFASYSDVRAKIRLIFFFVVWHR